MAKSWLIVPGRGEKISGEYQIVFNRNQDTEMKEANAHELMRAAQIASPDYTWQTVPVPGGFFIVEGTKDK